MHDVFWRFSELVTNVFIFTYNSFDTRTSYRLAEILLGFRVMIKLHEFAISIL